MVDGGALRDIAPTLLALMGLPQPPEMTGASLLVVSGVRSQKSEDRNASVHSGGA
jgi:arylsulfatase A-like enzyme